MHAGGLRLVAGKGALSDEVGKQGGLELQPHLGAEPCAQQAREDLADSHAAAATELGRARLALKWWGTFESELHPMQLKGNAGIARAASAQEAVAPLTVSIMRSYSTRSVQDSSTRFASKRWAAGLERGPRH